MVVKFGKDDDRSGSYIAGRSGAKPTTKKQEPHCYAQHVGRVVISMKSYS